VTGGTSGLGHAMARALAAAGEVVVLTGRSAERASQVAAGIPGAVGIALDVRSEASVARAVQEAWSRLGGLDMLVNNAGIGMRTVNPRFMAEPQGFWQVPPAGFRDVIETNLTGYFLVAREITPRLLAAGGGRIVNVSVNPATMTRAGFVPYGPSRAGTEAMSRVMAADLRGTGVTVNLLLPGGATATGMIPAEAPAGNMTLLDPAIMGPPIVWLASAQAAGVHDERIVATEFADWLRARPDAMTRLRAPRHDENMALQLAGEEPEAGPWRVVLLSTVVNAVTRRRPDQSGAGRPSVLAIDGRSNNGKTTLAARISELVPGSAVIHTDDIAWEHSRFGWADLLMDGILVPVHQGQAVSYRPPRWDSHGREGSIEVPQGCPLLIIEGDGAGRREVAHLIDALIWVQADERVTGRRAAARAANPPAADLANRAADGAPFDEDEWMAEEIPFNTAQRTWERAGIIVCGTPQISSDPSTEVVIAPPPDTP
jgi:NAD(P)-dependent dehydrogenase (short-subunit alcohol dehydrogenase family)